MLFKGKSPSLVHSPEPLTIETSDRLRSSAVHGRKDRNRPWKDEDLHQYITTSRLILLILKHWRFYPYNNVFSREQYHLELDFTAHV